MTEISPEQGQLNANRREGALNSEGSVGDEEKLNSIQFQQLELKDYLNQLQAEDELETLLKMKFERLKQEVEPIEKTFDPTEELQKIKKLEGAEKEAAVKIFKSKLVRQREAWSACTVFLRKKIEKNYDLPKEELLRWLDLFNRSYGFTESQNEAALAIIDNYYLNRRKVKEIRLQFPNNVALVNELSYLNFPQDTVFEISLGAISLNIYCDALSASRLHTGSMTTQPTHWRAFSYVSNCDLAVNYSVFNLEALKPGDDQRRSQVHEDQHQENALFSSYFEPKNYDVEALLLIYKSEQDPKNKKTLLESYLRAARKRALISAKDEIIAMKVSERPFLSWDIWFKEDGSAYDYLASARSLEDNQLFNRQVKKILVEEYREIIDNAILVFDELQFKGHYSTRQTVALLMDKPLIHWPKTVRRILEEKGETLSLRIP